MDNKNARQLKIMKEWKLTYTQAWAISHIGRKKGFVYPHKASCKVSLQTIRSLVKGNFVMWVDEGVMLTCRGDAVWQKMHPYSRSHKSRGCD